MSKTSVKRTGDKIAIDGAYQFNAYYHGKKTQRFWHYAKLHEAATELAVVPGDRVLDAGCGSGLLASLLAANTGAEIWGIDANPSAIAFCMSQYKSQHNLHFKQALADELPFDTGSFEKIVFLEVLEHLSASQGLAVIKKFYDLLQPGGKLVISTPNKRSLWPLQEFLLDKLKLVPNLKEGQHELLYSARRLRAVGETEGFNCISRKTINFLSPWLAAISWKLALGMHKLETKSHWLYGSLLLYTFQKPAHTRVSSL